MAYKFSKNPQAADAAAGGEKSTSTPASKPAAPAPGRPAPGARPAAPAARPAAPAQNAAAAGRFAAGAQQQTSATAAPTRPAKSGGDNKGGKMGGYRMAIAFLTVVLVVISLFYFNMHRQQIEEYDALSIQRDSIQSALTTVVNEYGVLETSNNKLTADLAKERSKADSLQSRLRNERSWNASKIQKYEREVETLRTIMQGYLQQVDSLNSLNQELLSQNVSFKKHISAVELRAEEAEERANELDARVREGERLTAQDITIATLNDLGRNVSKVARAERLSVNFVLAPNQLTRPGSKEIFVRIISPDGYILTTEQLPTFKFNGEDVTYTASREIDYQNRTLPVNIFFSGSGFIEGVYHIELYNNDALIGSAEINVL